MASDFRRWENPSACSAIWRTRRGLCLIRRVTGPRRSVPSRRSIGHLRVAQLLVHRSWAGAVATR